MTSSVHYKFKSQKEPSRVTFDGTGISVFELKREIITRDRLGDGTDFELSIYNQDTNEEYDDDTTIIPRSTYVVARRLPAARPGRGGAARYVTGSMPVRARNNAKAAAASKTTTAAKTQSLKADMSSAQTEEERIKAMFNLEADQWKHQQQEMANATPVFTGRPTKGKQMNVPEGEPPHGYICYRCGKKGHWIQACPTNDDPEYDGRLRVKRTTGIPRSFLKTVAKTDIDSSSEEAKRLMVNADGDYVVAETDQKAWKQYQEKAKASAAAQEAAAAGSKELQDLGIECSIDMKMFVDPMKTPCCGKTYCNDCITNALIESDLVCPGCSTENVLIDDLVPDKDVQDRIKAYRTQRADETQERVASRSPEATTDAISALTAEKAKSPASKKSRSNSPASRNGDIISTSKKRPAEDDKASNQNNDEEAPAMKKQRSQESNNTTTTKAASSTPSLDSIFSQNLGPMGNFNPMGQPGFSPMPGFPQGMPFMGMPGNMPLMNPMMMMPGAANFMGNSMNGVPSMNGMNGMMNGMGFPNQQANGMFPPNFNTNINIPNHNMQFSNGYGGGGQQHHQQQQKQQNNNTFPGVPTGPAAMTQNRGPPQQQQGQFSNQQRNVGNNGENDAYFRQPVNPHRHQARQRRVRPSDYREL